MNDHKFDVGARVSITFEGHMYAQVILIVDGDPKPMSLDLADELCDRMRKATDAARSNIATLVAARGR